MGSAGNYPTSDWKTPYFVLNAAQARAQSKQPQQEARYSRCQDPREGGEEWEGGSHLSIELPNAIEHLFCGSVQELVAWVMPQDCIRPQCV